MRISISSVSFHRPLFFLFCYFFLSSCLSSVFHRKTSRQDRLGTTIANSLDPEHPPFCPSSNASSATRAFISALKLRRCLDFISVPSPRQGFYLLIAGPNCRGTARVLKKLHRCASRVDLQALAPLLKLFGRLIAQRGMQAQPIVILLDELFDIRSQMF